MDAVITRINIFDNITGPVTQITDAIDGLLNRLDMFASISRDLGEPAPLEDMGIQMDIAAAAVVSVNDTVEAFSSTLQKLDSVPFEDIQRRAGSATASLVILDDMCGKFSSTLQDIDAAPLDDIERRAGSAAASLVLLDVMCEEFDAALQDIDAAPFEDIEPRLGSTAVSFVIVDAMCEKFGSTLQGIDSAPLDDIIQNVGSAAASLELLDAICEKLVSTLQDINGAPFDITQGLDSSGASLELLGAAFEKFDSALHDTDGAPIEYIEQRLGTAAASLELLDAMFGKFGSTLQGIDSAPIEDIEQYLGSADASFELLVAMCEKYNLTLQEIQSALFVDMQRELNASAEAAERSSSVLSKVYEFAKNIGKTDIKLNLGLEEAGGFVNALVDKVNQISGLFGVAFNTQTVFDFFKGCVDTANPQIQKITTSLSSAFNDVRASIGAQLLPGIIGVLTVIQNHMPQIQQMLLAFVPIIQIVIFAIGKIVEAAFAVYDVFKNFIAANMQPILVALAVLFGIIAVQAIIAGISALVSFLAAAWPLLLIVAIITAVIMAVHSLGVSFETIFGFIGFVVGTAVASIVNIFIDLWNYMAGFVNNFARIFDDPVAGIVGLFVNLFTFILTELSSFAGIVDRIFGTNIADTISGFSNRVQNWYDKAFGPTKEHVKKIEHVNPDNWGAKGAEFGQRLGAFVDNPNIPMLGNIANNTANTAANTKPSAGINEENVPYLRDIAERDAINRFTTAEIHIVQHNENHISSEMDLDGVVNLLASGTREAMEGCAEGVHL